MEQKTLYTQFYSKLLALDPEKAKNFEQDCFGFAWSKTEFIIDKKIMIDQYFFYLNTIEEEMKMKWNSFKEFIKMESEHELGEWLVFNEVTEEWE